MRKICVAAIQMSVPKTCEKSIEKAEAMTRKAASDGANLVLLPELFETKYFCQERRYEYFELATAVLENRAVMRFLDVTRELSIAMPISFFERDGNEFYNSVAMLDCGEMLGVYRKTHIPDDHFYQEKFYFSPGNTGFKVWNTHFGRVGVGICWDQWFPEAARCMVLQGAEVLLYPTAIGSEPIIECDSMPHWRRCMQGHAAANVVPVVAANRIGTEKVFPCVENAGQSSQLTFYGSSFITDETGDIIQAADRDSDCIIMHTFDLSAIDEARYSWGIFRDRRPEMYGRICGE